MRPDKRKSFLRVRRATSNVARSTYARTLTLSFARTRIFEYMFWCCRICDYLCTLWERGTDKSFPSNARDRLISQISKPRGDAIHINSQPKKSKKSAENRIKMTDKRWEIRDELRAYSAQLCWINMFCNSLLRRISRPRGHLAATLVLSSLFSRVHATL